MTTVLVLIVAFARTTSSILADDNEVLRAYYGIKIEWEGNVISFSKSASVIFGTPIKEHLGVI